MIRAGVVLVAAASVVGAMATLRFVVRAGVLSDAPTALLAAVLGLMVLPAAMAALRAAHRRASDAMIDPPGTPDEPAPRRVRHAGHRARWPRCRRLAARPRGRGDGPRTPPDPTLGR